MIGVLRDDMSEKQAYLILITAMLIMIFQFIGLAFFGEAPLK